MVALRAKKGMKYIFSTIFPIKKKKNYKQKTNNYFTCFYISDFYL